MVKIMPLIKNLSELKQEVTVLYNLCLSKDQVLDELMPSEIVGDSDIITSRDGKYIYDIFAIDPSTLKRINYGPLDIKRVIGIMVNGVFSDPVNQMKTNKREEGESTFYIYGVEINKIKSFDDDPLLQKYLCVLLILARLFPHETGWYHYYPRYVMEQFEQMGVDKKGIATLVQNGVKRAGVDFKVVGLRNPIRCFSVDWFLNPLKSSWDKELVEAIDNKDYLVCDIGITPEELYNYIVYGEQ